MIFGTVRHQKRGKRLGFIVQNDIENPVQAPKERVPLCENCTEIEKNNSFSEKPLIFRI